MIKLKVEQHVSPEIVEARDATLKAMKEAEQGWQKAMDKIAERVGLTKATKVASGEQPSGRVA